MFSHPLQLLGHTWSWAWRSTRSRPPLLRGTPLHCNKSTTQAARLSWAEKDFCWLSWHAACSDVSLQPFFLFGFPPRSFRNVLAHTHTTRQSKTRVRSWVLEAVTMMRTMFWNVTLCSLVDVHQHSSGMYCLHFSCLAYSLTLSIDMARSSRTTANVYRTTCYHIPEYGTSYG
jgi:hypothetical protein